jgi:hypothetical protein
MIAVPCPPLSVIPAKAGIARRSWRAVAMEIPVFAGMTAGRTPPTRNLSPPPAGGRVREGVRTPPTPRPLP